MVLVHQATAKLHCRVAISSQKHLLSSRNILLGHLGRTQNTPTTQPAPARIHSSDIQTTPMWSEELKCCKCPLASFTSKKHQSLPGVHCCDHPALLQRQGCPADPPSHPAASGTPSGTAHQEQQGWLLTSERTTSRHRCWRRRGCCCCCWTRCPTSHRWRQQGRQQLGHHHRSRPRGGSGARSQS